MPYNHYFFHPDTKVDILLATSDGRSIVPAMPAFPELRSTDPRIPAVLKWAIFVGLMIMAGAGEETWRTWEN